MRAQYRTWLPLLLAIVFPVMANAEAFLNEVDEANQAFAEAILAKDVDHLVNDYTDDACIIAPNTPKTCGKEAIRKFWETVIASNPEDVEIKTQTAQHKSDLGFATGELLITGADSAVQKSRFVIVLNKVGDDWKLRVDSWTPQ
ncbi:nuclear transport factor 2 family protein [Marinobacteraceae bacterium S3BR75-40.1]